MAPLAAPKSKQQKQQLKQTVKYFVCCLPSNRRDLCLARDQSSVSSRRFSLVAVRVKVAISQILPHISVSHHTQSFVCDWPVTDSDQSTVDLCKQAKILIIIILISCISFWPLWLYSAQPAASAAATVCWLPCKHSQKCFSASSLKKSAAASVASLLMHRIWVHQQIASTEDWLFTHFKAATDCLADKRWLSLLQIRNSTTALPTFQPRRNHQHRQRQRQRRHFTHLPLCELTASFLPFLPILCTCHHHHCWQQKSK